jgi:U3 small nucleolar RNA-associated protein 18
MLKLGRLSDYEDITAKDETEKKLEKLVFGDEAGFVDSLKPSTTVHELQRVSSTGEDEEQHESDDDDFEGVADQDVWSASTFGNLP